MQLKALWEFLKMLPFFIELFKFMKDKYGDATVAHHKNSFMNEVKGKNRASIKAGHVKRMFK